MQSFLKKIILILIIIVISVFPLAAQISGLKGISLKPHKYEMIIEIRDIGTFYLKPMNISLGEIEIIKYEDGNDIVLRKRSGKIRIKNLMIYIDNNYYKTVQKWTSVFRSLNSWFEGVKKVSSVNRKEFMLSLREKKTGNIIFKLEGKRSWPSKLVLRCSSSSLPQIILSLVVEELWISNR